MNQSSLESGGRMYGSSFSAVMIRIYEVGGGLSIIMRNQAVVVKAVVK